MIRVAETCGPVDPNLYSVMMKSAAFSPVRILKSQTGKLLFWILIAILLLISFPARAQTTYSLNKAPYYKNFQKTYPKEADLILFSGIGFHPSLKSEFAYQGRERALMPVMDVMDAYIDSLGWIVAWNGREFSDRGMPFVFVGSAEADAAPPPASMHRTESDKYPPVVLHLDKPSKKWRDDFSKQFSETDGNYFLMIWIGFSEYPKADKGIFKKKVVLGTGYEREIRFLSAIDKPVEVLQITGVLLDKKGNVVRAGAEAFFHEDTPFWVQVLEMSKSIDDKSLHNVILEEKRDDLPGNPLAWKVAVHHLLHQLTQKPHTFL